MWVRYLVFVALVIVVAAVVLGVQWARRRLAADPATELGTAHEASVKRARRQLRKAERAHAKAVARARKAVKKAAKDAPLVTVGPVALRPLTITLRGTERTLSERTTFDVDVVGEIVTLVKDGRTVADDRREVYLTVKDPAWGDVVKLPPDQLEGVRRLVVAGEVACRNLGEARRARDERVASAEAELDRVRADTAHVDAARMTLEDLEGAPPQTLQTPQPPPPERDDRGDEPHTDDPSDRP